MKGAQSAFAGTELAAMLAAGGIAVVIVAGVVAEGGVAEGGVAATALDAIGLVFRTVIAVDAIRGVSASSERAAIQAMLAAGAEAME